jgi:uncharacterized protein with GYD domain
MPLFLVKGTIAGSFAAELRNSATTATSHEQTLQREAAALGGTLVQLNFVAGTWDLLALFDLPIDATTPMMLSILSGGLFAPGAVRLALALDAKQVAESITASHGGESPWGDVRGKRKE